MELRPSIRRSRLTDVHLLERHAPLTRLTSTLPTLLHPCFPEAKSSAIFGR